MSKVPAPLLFLWLAIVIPVVGVGLVLYFTVQGVNARPTVVYKTPPVAVSPTVVPTATPSAALKIPTRTSSAAATRAVVPTKTGGVTK